MRYVKKTLAAALMLFAVFLLTGMKSEAARHLFDVTVKDGYSTQKIPMYYGTSPSGHMAYYTNQPTVYVAPGAKTVRFSVTNVTDAGCGNFSFQNDTLAMPGSDAKMNLFNYYTNGKRRAYMFTVKKLTAPKITWFRVAYPTGRKVLKISSKKAAQIKFVVTADRKANTQISITDRKGRLVWEKKLKSSAKMKYVVSWRGLAGSRNKLGIKRGRAIPNGTYRITVKSSIPYGKRSITARKTIHIKVER